MRHSGSREEAGSGRRYVAVFLGVVLVAWSLPRLTAAEEPDSPSTLHRLAEALAGRRVGEIANGAGDAIRPRGGSSLRDIYRRAIRAVPLVISKRAIGSAIVIAADSADSSGWIITNQHVVEEPFRDTKGTPWVSLLFYDPQLASEPFEGERLVKCAGGGQKSAWCAVLLRSIRVGVVVGMDAARDLALLYVANLPRDVLPIHEGGIEGVEPGDDVAAIGHPEGFLWTLTRGIVSGVRLKYPMGNSHGTVIQTQAPIAPGNSGGPLLTFEGQLIGVITWVISNTQGLNGAIAINEVQAFASELAARFSRH